MTGVPAHAPAVHTSLVEQVSWSLHAVPSATWVAMHMPLTSHAPVLQTGIPVVHAVPAARGTPLQEPFIASHIPAKHPTVIAEQSLAVPPWHMPAWHVLPTVQRSPVSTHVAPFFAASGVGSHFPVAVSQATVLHSLYG